MEVRTLDFKGNNVQELTLDELRLTYQEKKTDQTPQFNGIFHTDLIDRISSIIEKNGKNFDIQTIFAADNKNKNASGVTINPLIEKEYGPLALQAYALRRVFTTIRINDMEDDETNTGMAIAFHQDGIQIAIGPNVKICHNQCILSAERTISNYGGDGKIKSIDKMMDIVDDWMHNFGEQRVHDQKVISQMKTIPCSYVDVLRLIGQLNVTRVVKDTKIKALKAHEANLGKTYPLNQTQISIFTENYLEEVIKRGNSDMTLWDVYNISTDLYKAGRTDFPNIISQNIAWSEFLIKEYEL